MATNQNKVEGLNTNLLQQFPLEGYTVHVIDGDTIDLTNGRDKVVVRLAGIDAPETTKHGVIGQPGNAASIAYLQSVVTQYRSQLQLYIVPGESTHGRVVGILAVGKVNINLAMVKRGLVSTYSPPQGVRGVQMGKFRAAENKAMAAQMGLFQDPAYRAQVALNRSRSDMANVAMANTERVAENFSARVRARMLSGIRSEDARRNAPNAWHGMNPGRLDFGGGRTPMNPISMDLANANVTNLREIEKAIHHLSGLGDNVFSFLDLETTGLGVMDADVLWGQLTFGRGMKTQVTEAAINPTMPWHEQFGPTAFGADYDTEIYNTFRKMAMKVDQGVYRTENMPREIANVLGVKEGPMDMAHLDALARHSGVPSDMWTRTRAEMLRLQKAGATADFGQLSAELLTPKSHRSEFLFVHNAYFESRRLATGMSDEVYGELLTSGKLAGGSLTYKSPFSTFDPELTRLRDKARIIERNAGMTGKNMNRHLRNAAQHRMKWYSRLRGMIAGKIQAPAGIKMIDVQDIARGVFAMGGLADESFLMSSSGLMKQETLAALLGLAPEAHLAMSDAAQSAVIASKLIEMGDRIKDAVEGGTSIGEVERRFLEKSKKMQSLMAHYNIAKDISNRIKHLPPGANPLAAEVLIKESDLTQFTVEDYFIGGELTPTAVRYFEEERTVKQNIGEYITRRMQQAGLATEETAPKAAQELLDVVQAGRTVFETDTGDDIIRMALDKNNLVGMHMEYGTPMAAMRQYFISRDVELHQGSKASLEGWEGIKSSFAKALESTPRELKQFWLNLDPKYRKMAGISAAVVAGIGAVSIIRGLFEKDREPQPMSVDLEQYMASRDMNDALEYLGRTSVDMNGMLANANAHAQAMLSAKKDPSRYYPGRML